jgi:hypothetical protein
MRPGQSPDFTYSCQASTEHFEQCAEFPLLCRRIVRTAPYSCAQDGLRAEKAFEAQQLSARHVDYREGLIAALRG